MRDLRSEMNGVVAEQDEDDDDGQVTIEEGGVHRQHRKKAKTEEEEEEEDREEEDREEEEGEGGVGVGRGEQEIADAAAEEDAWKRAEEKMMEQVAPVDTPCSHISMSTNHKTADLRMWGLPLGAANPLPGSEVRLILKP